MEDAATQEHHTLSVGVISAAYNAAVLGPLPYNAPPGQQAVSVIDRYPIQSWLLSVVTVLTMCILVAHNLFQHSGDKNLFRDDKF